MKNLVITAIGILLIGMSACKKDDETTSEVEEQTEAPAVYSKIYGATDIYVQGDYVVIKCNARPDHKSPYYQNTSWESSMYEAYNGSNVNFNKNPNKISSMSYTFKIPVNPAVSSNHAATPMGPIGVAINGVPFYNQYAAPGDDLADEINTFDQYNGHPTQNGSYHYHMEPTYLTALKGNNALMGFLLDGFPVYGPYENGNPVSNGDLDVYHGHTHATTEYPNGIYHYHITSADPYINGSGFYGSQGTVTQ